MADEEQILISDQYGVTVVRLGTGFASIYESDLTRLTPLRELAETAFPERIVIDLANTRYFGSAFIGFLLTIASRLKERGDGRLGLAGLVPFATMALQTTKADTILGLYDSVDEAVSSLRQSTPGTAE
ncbi:MAG: STAS domain-containing protein [Rhodopirellula sp.]|nr:STAS domain-containing protein [Rhodopirellula sp.]